jgi:predicted Zn-dependent protease
VGQAPQKPTASDPSGSVKHAVDLAENGRCHEALPALRKSLTRIADKELRFEAAMASARCGMSMNQMDAALEAIALLNRDFPKDPKVLYVTTRYFSELASRASQELAATAPSSKEALELDAEAYESQGKWDEAAAEYNMILQKDPKTPGIHYRLGRDLLLRPATATTTDSAKQEFEAELKIDPTNAASEFSLGELARQAEQWDEAIQHFSRAANLDDGFSEAFLALGISLNSAGKFSDAVGPLEKYVKMQTGDPAGHYQLAIACARTGRREEADREMALQREAESKVEQGAPRTRDKLQSQ